MKLARVLPTPTNINYFIDTRIKRHGAQYKVFGVFTLLNYLLPYFMWSAINPAYTTQALVLRSIAGTLCVILIAHEYWPSMFKRFLPLYWHATLLFCLPFASTVFLLDNQGATFWLMSMALAILLLVVLVDWLSFTVLLGLGVVMGYGFCFLKGSLMPLQLNSENVFLAVYMYIFTTMIGLVFCRSFPAAHGTCST